MSTTKERAEYDAREVLSAIEAQIRSLEGILQRLEKPEAVSEINAKIDSLKNTHFNLSGTKNHEFKSLLQS